MLRKTIEIEKSSHERQTDFSLLLEKLKRVKPKLVVIFGSYSQNPATARDLDILIISEEFQDVYYQHRRLLLPNLYGGKRIDPYCFTPKEFKILFGCDHPLIKAILNHHIDLIGVFDEYL